MDKQQRQRRAALRKRYRGRETLRQIEASEGLSLSRVSQLINKRKVERAARRQMFDVPAILELARRTELGEQS